MSVDVRGSQIGRIFASIINKGYLESLVSLLHSPPVLHPFEVKRNLEKTIFSRDTPSGSEGTRSMEVRGRPRSLNARPMSSTTSGIQRTTKQCPSNTKVERTSRMYIHAYIALREFMEDPPLD